MYYLQYREISTATWMRFTTEGTFETALEALQRRDEVAAAYPNDGLPRACRAVSEDGDVLEYGKQIV